ncbi:Clavaminate synthase-like protein [Flagelloscypha sp. PMI_526]|nr:Clavaminate synthase-like protein [Flagelloscypha sp. PMI_526]
MATLTRRVLQPISRTPEGAVQISYSDLTSQPDTLLPSIEEAFGSSPKSLGIIIVRDLPPTFNQYRERLLHLAHKFADLDESTREKYIDPASSYSFGWSHGKEIMNGQPDTLKGSFYANPVVDTPTVPEEEKKQFPEYYGSNIWPTEPETEGFEDAFKDLGRFIFKIGTELAAACQPFALAHLDSSIPSLPELISTSQTTKSRLLHYFPPPDDFVSSEDEPIDSWCGFHLDHSLLTGLCSAMFIKHGPNGPEVVGSPSPSSGLYIRSRGGDLTKVSIPQDCLAFQTGEALELATGKRLRATPHCVRVGATPAGAKISRETFVVFMQPNSDQKLNSEETFGQFSKRIFAEHYDPQNSGSM